MNSIAIVFLLANAALLIGLPRNYASILLLFGTCYMTLGQEIQFGPFHFTIFRILIAVGFLRVIARGERLKDGLNGLDGLIFLWAAWAVTSSIFHKDFSREFINHLGTVYDACGIYFLFRIFLQDVDDLENVCRILPFLLIPIALEMIYEVLAVKNLFSIFGGVLEIPVTREGRIRAIGPFGHPILAGTVGAACLPLVVGVWRCHKKTAAAGIVACMVIVIASASSGPILSFMVAIAALSIWRYRQQMRIVRWGAVSLYLLLEIVMNDPAYFIMARLDLVGGSTGWHRAELIHSAIHHIDEWWVAGTDYTRHWMPTGVSWSRDHTDITNEYLGMGVLGGLPLMALFIGVLAKGFSYVGQALGRTSDLPEHSRFLIWTFGGALFVHAVTFISISYFDQSIVFLYFTLAAIGSICSGLYSSPNPDETTPLVDYGTGDFTRTGESA